MKQDRDMGRYLELEKVMNQIITVFSDEDEQQEELETLMASAEPSDSQKGYRQKEL
jgi:hypothetical protein